MKYAATAFASAGMVAMTNAHGFITKPSARMPGDAMTKACGQQVYYNQMGDNYGNVQGELQVASSQDDYDEAACKIWMCKGYKFEDNKDNVHQFSVGEEIPITVDIRAPHTGVANVSVVDTATNTMISKELISWDNYASVSSTIPDDQKQFSIKMPDVGGKCSEPGACVIQWYWNAASIDQTYESCIDFTVSGSGAGSPDSGSSSGSGSSSEAEAAPASTQAAVSSAPAKTAIASTPSSTQQEVASTCACTNEKRDALPQDSYCQPSTSTVTSVSTSVSQETVTISKEVTVTATHTQTVTPTQVAAQETTAAAEEADATNSATSSKCTTSITLTRSGTSVDAAATATGAPFPLGSSNTTAGPTAPSVSLNPVYSSVMANVTSAIPTGALTSIVPSASVNAVLSSYMANVTSILPTNIAATGTKTAPTGLPSGYATATSQPTAGAALATGSDEAPAEGMSLKEILEWIAYLIKGVFQDGEEAAAAQASGSATEVSPEAAESAPAPPTPYGKRWAA